jgi:transposase
VTRSFFVKPMNTRELKALELAARKKIVFKDGRWLVPSHVGTRTYYGVRFTETGPTCECEDWTTRRLDCKHIIAARLVIERDGGKEAPPLNTDVMPEKPRRQRNWKAINEASIHEKHRLEKLLAALCRGVEAPPEFRAARRDFSDVLFACIYKVYCTYSSRRFGSDLIDAHTKGYLSKPMHPNKTNCYLENPALTPILRRLITATSLPLAAVETVFAPDSTGFATGRFNRWFDKKYGEFKADKHWVKAHGIIGKQTHIVTAVEVLEENSDDYTQFKRLVETTAENFTIAEVCADKAYLSHAYFEYVRSLGGTLYCPFKTNSAEGEAGTEWNRMYHFFHYRQDDFLAKYHQRSQVEAVFSAVKAKWGDGVRSWKDAAMRNEVYCKFICHNICVLIMAQIELGIEAEFWPKDGKPAFPRLVHPA